jgi:hypothetical protein
MLTFLKKLSQWLRSLPHWLDELRITWFCASAPMCVVALSFLSPKPIADNLRYAGLFLQLAGIAAVLWDIRSRGRLFNRPSLATFLFSWLSRRPRFTPRPIQLSATAKTQVNSSATFGYLIVQGYKPEDPVDVKIDALRKNIEVVQEALQKQDVRLSQTVAEVANRVRQEEQTRASDLHHLNQKMAELGAGSLEVELTGIVWLVLGLVLATIPTEIASAFT